MKNDIKDFKEFLTGLMGSKEKFSQKCLDEYNTLSDSLGSLFVDCDILKEKYNLLTSKSSGVSMKKWTQKS